MRKKSPPKIDPLERWAKLAPGLSSYLGLSPDNALVRSIVSRTGRWMARLAGSPHSDSLPECTTLRGERKVMTSSGISDSAQQEEASMLRWTRVNSIATVFNAGFTFLAVCGAVWAISVYREQRNIAASQLSDLRDSIRASANTALYVQGNELTRFIGQNPKLYQYFYRDDANETYSQRDKVLWEKFNTEKEEIRGQVWMACELLADFISQAFLLNETNPPIGPLLADWQTWRQSFLDNYAEVPMLREWYRRHDTWYTVHKRYLEPDFQQRIKRERDGSTKAISGK